jgi:alcohol dehydrogenase (cytochrome c)
VWTHESPNLNNPPSTVAAGILTTAANLLITGDDQKNVIIFSADKGQVLWHHEGNANQSNGAITYMLDGKQWILYAAGDSLFAYSLNK